MIILLTSLGADSNLLIKYGPYGSALVAACSAAVKLLIRSQADVNSQLTSRD
jgi:hypothetical protein